MRDLVRLYSLLKPHWARFTLAVAASALYAAFRVKLLTLVKPLYDQVLNARESSSFEVLSIPMTVLIPLLFLGAGVFGYISQYFMNSVGQRAIADLRNRLFERLEFQKVAFFADHPTGVLVSRMVSDVDRIQTALTERAVDALRGPFQIVGVVSYLLYRYTDLALVTFLAAPALVIPLVRLGTRLRRISRRSQERMGEISSILHETVTGIRIVKAFAMEQFELAKFKEATARLVRVNLRAVKLLALLPPMMELMAGTLAAGFILYGNHMIREQKLTTGEFTVFLIGLFMLYQPIKSLTRVNADLQQAVAASQRVFHVVDLPGERETGETGEALPPVKGEIVFENVSFSYGDEDVLSDINVHVPAGTVLALVGSSGAGKSTLASLLPRFYEPATGRILCDGTDIGRVTLSSLRRQIGIVSQDVILFNDTVRANLTCGREEIREEDVLRAAGAANAHEFIAALPQGYDTIVGEKGLRLSGGQRQRIAIARALLKNAPILILDEATSSLDVESERLVQEALARLMKDRTVLVIAHRLSTIRKADRILVLDGGRIVESGTHAELLELRGHYYRYCTLQKEDGLPPEREQAQRS